MYQVLILDDNPIHLNNTYELTKKILDAQEFKISVSNCLDDFILKEISPDIALLDIDFGRKETGIDFATKIRYVHPDCQIIFLSSHTNYVSQVYDVEHLMLIIKEQADEYLQHALTKAISKLKELETDFFWLKPSTQPAQKLFLKDIFYFERSSRTSFIYLENDILKTPLPLDEIEKQIPVGKFIRSHQSFLVNPEHIFQYKKDQCILRNNTVIPISRSYKKTFHEHFMNHLGSQVVF